MSITRLLCFLLCACPVLLGATGVPVVPVVALDTSWLEVLPARTVGLTMEDLTAPASAAERAALADMFGAPLVLSDRADDIRKISAFTGELEGVVDEARGLIDAVRDPLRQVSNLVDAQLTNLPLGIRRNFGNVEVFLAIGAARLKPTYAEVDLYLGLDLPNTEQDPIFMAEGVKWSRKSGFIGEVEMRLIADWGINLQEGKSRLILHQTGRNGSGGCSAVITCDGLQSVNLEMSVVLSRDWVVPVVNGEALTDPNLNDEVDPYSNARVSAHFAGAFNRDNGFYFETGFDNAFAFTGKEDVHVDVAQVVVDFSSVKNASLPAMEFPEGYQSNFVQQAAAGDPVEVDPRWQGLYISGVKVTIPEAFREDSNTDFEVGAPQIIIDDTGVSAHLYAAGIMDLGTKRVDEWAFSVDSLNFKVLHSTFQKAEITGLIHIPMLGAQLNCEQEVTGDMPLIEEDCLDYRAIIRPQGYYFGVSLNRDYCIPVFKAGEVVIEENTKIELEYVNRELTATATLYGAIDVQMGEPGTDAEFSVQGLSFDALILRTRQPYFEPGVWDFPEAITARFKGFELGFREIHLARDSVNDNGGRNCQLFFQAYVSVDTELELDATAAMRMMGELRDTDGGQRWGYRSLKLDALRIQASTSSFTVGAALAFYGQDEPDDDWGSGFYGYGELILRALPSGSVGFGAVAQFGKKDGYKYFMVDVMGSFAAANIPVLPGLNLGAIGGGVYKNMTANQDFMDMDKDGGDKLANITDRVESERNAPEPTNALNGFLGRSLADKQYFVAPGNLGVYVQVVLVAPNEEAYSITGKLEMEINDDNGWQASIMASAQAMNPPNYSGDLKIEQGVGVFVVVAISKLQDEVSFEATAEVFVNVYDGRVVGINTPLPQGDTNRSRFVSENGFAGGVYLKFSNEEWYFRMGLPTAPLGIRVPVAEAYAYFCVGSSVPPIPPLPDNVTDIVGSMDLSRDQSALASASGFAFGAGLDIGADGNFLIFRYEFNAGIGFDINIRNYGDAVCADDPDGSSIGVNGWYAAGQAWAYVSGSLKVLGSNVASAGLAAVLQLTGPKPTMARGVLAGYYQIGRGRKRSFRLEAQFGNTCTIVGRGGESPFANTDVISGTSVRDGATDIDPKTIPAAFTTLPMQKNFELNEVTYKVKLVTNRLTEADSGELVAAALSGFQGDYGFEVTPGSYLKPNTRYRYEVAIKVEKYADLPDDNINRPTWHLEKEESKDIFFTTGDGPTAIDPDNLSETYPFNGMINFYAQEYDEGVVQLYREQPSVTQNLSAVWTSATGEVTTSDVRVFQRFIRFDIPQNLATNTLYQLTLVQEVPSPTVGGSSMDAFSDRENYLKLWSLLQSRVVYTSYFRTSRYATFAAKVAALTNNISDRPGEQHPRQSFSNTEGWSEGEIFQFDEDEVPMVTIRMAQGENYPNSYLRENVLSEFNPLSLGGSFAIGNANNQMQYARFENVWLGVPKDSVYFTAAGNTAYPAAVEEANFLTNTYSANTSGQSFVFGFTKIISQNLERFKAGVMPLPTKVLGILQGVAPFQGTPPANLPSCTYCLTNPGSFVTFLNSTSGTNPGGVVIDNDFILSNNLPSAWSQEEDFDFALNRCSLKRPVRMALRRLSKLDDIGYRNKSVPVRFSYAPPGKSPHSITRNVRVK